LHGNAKKKETAPDGSKDENVFDIMQGVSINLFVKTGKKAKGELAEVFQYDLHGKREGKYEALYRGNLKNIKWNNVKLHAPNYLLVAKDFDLHQKYKAGFKTLDLFVNTNSGIKSHRDDFVVDYESQVLQKRIEAFLNKDYSDDEIRRSYELRDNRDWQLSEARKDNRYDKNKLQAIAYRPLDIRTIYYDKRLIDFGRESIMRHFLFKDNIGLILVSQSQAANLNFFDCVYIVKSIVDTNMFRRGGPFVFPLYLYPETNGQQSIEQKTGRTPNLNKEILQKIAEGLGLTFTPEKENTPNTFAPIDLLDYIYAVLHSPTYRSTYKEFLKIDFPRVPYPKDAPTFWQLVQLGGELRQIHLLESPITEQYITGYPVNGPNTVGKVRYDSGKVYINETQYFEGVPEPAWSFYIGGYQPAQKWLKDRKDRTLSFEDILHYQKIIVTLTETNRLMQEIDKIEIA
jgi:predicted helicase